MNDARGKRPFRAEHVGSLLRPQHLLDARQNLEGDQYQTTVGSLNFNELQELENVAIKDAIRLQEDVGLQSITDGEFRRRFSLTISFGPSRASRSSPDSMDMGLPIINSQREKGFGIWVRSQLLAVQHDATSI